MFELSIIIISYNVREYLLKCIDSIKAHTKNISHEIIVVDNNSGDGSAEALEQTFGRDVTVIRNTGNVGFAKANNQAYEKSKGEFILMLNPDTEVKEGSIARVLAFMKNTPSAGIAACRIMGPDGKFQKSIHPFTTVRRNLLSAFFLDRLLMPEHRRSCYYQAQPFGVDSVSGAFMLVRRAALNGKPLLNPEYFMYAEEKDLALRLSRAGWPAFFVPSAEILHYGARSTGLTPITMFLELQKSQVKFYLNFYGKGYAFALCMSWWLTLCTQTVASLMVLVTRKGRRRFVLFLRAALSFPVYVIHLFADENRHPSIHP